MQLLPFGGGVVGGAVTYENEKVVAIKKNSKIFLLH